MSEAERLLCKMEEQLQELQREIAEKRKEVEEIQELKAKIAAMEAEYQELMKSDDEEVRKTPHLQIHLPLRPHAALPLVNLQLRLQRNH